MNNEEERTIKSLLRNIFYDKDKFEYFCILLKNKVTGSITGDRPPASSLLDQIIEERIALDCPHCDAHLGFKKDMNLFITECYECANIIGDVYRYSLYSLKDSFFNSFLVAASTRPLYGGIYLAYLAVTFRYQGNSFHTSL